MGLGSDEAAVAVFLEACPAEAWADLGVRGVRALDGEVVVSRRGSTPASLGRALWAGGRWYRLRDERATAARPQAACAPSFAEDGARAGALIEAQVGDKRAAGTLGLSFFGTDGHAYLVSNWHVLCAEQLGCTSGARVSLAHGERPIARVHAAAPVDLAGVNRWDLAVARYDDVRAARGGFASRRGFDGARAAPTRLAPPRRGELYFKVGATTGYREARYAGVGAHTIGLGPGRRGVHFRDLYFFESTGARRFSLGGDSGSIVVHAESGDACGLLIGGFDTERGSVSVACPLHQAFQVVGCARTAEGEALPCFDYPRPRTSNLEWASVGATLPLMQMIGAQSMSTRRAWMAAFVVGMMGAACTSPQVSPEEGRYTGPLPQRPITAQPLGRPCPGCAVASGHIVGTLKDSEDFPASRFALQWLKAVYSLDGQVQGTEWIDISGGGLNKTIDHAIGAYSYDEVFLQWMDAQSNIGITEEGIPID